MRNTLAIIAGLALMTGITIISLGHHDLKGMQAKSAVLNAPANGLNLSAPARTAWPRIQTDATEKLSHRPFTYR